ncbi:DNA polymerase III subunit delta [Kangiella sediminilitoris]|uniref:DNA polymerase III subunit delta n=1 Tax=Kangiella sediminilitoris TaxID=1144748 RepID=A0A1B3BDL7_9GAMM|nr:DNA polymerase III subunit delta [Kangiella sediminilitoris]AOE50787.1 DNA polymerase III, delta subunit [Kangiella sediminilitoris]
MKVYPEKLEQALNQHYPVFLVAGDEPWQKMEAADQIRAHCKDQGILERQIIEDSTASNPLADQAGTMSLFAESRLLEWRFDKSIKKAQGEAIQSFISSQPSDVLLIIAPKLSNEKRTSWFKTLEQVGIVVEVWPIPAERLGGWLRQRATKLDLKLDNDALQVLVERCEGNLLAAHQDLQMLALLAKDGVVTGDNIREYVGESARYSMFELADACLLGQAERALRMLASIQAEGTYPLPVVNQLLRECQQLALWSEEVAAGTPIPEIFKANRVWPKKQKVYQAALSNGSVKKWYAMIQRLTMIDKGIKGQADIDVWQEMAQVVCLISGVNPFRARKPQRSAEQPSQAAKDGLSNLKKAFGMS